MPFGRGRQDRNLRWMVWRRRFDMRLRSDEDETPTLAHAVPGWSPSFGAARRDPQVPMLIYLHFSISVIITSSATPIIHS